jgi:chromosome segregation ATPase
MSWDYHKLGDDKGHQQDMWPAASDLFMMLSTIFLLLFVVSSLRNGAETIKSQIEYQQMLVEAQDHQEQNRVYNALKDNYLETNATKEEQQLYAELMDKLSLLQEEANLEKQRLTKEAQENRAKETALNRYQQIVRNIINANMLAKANLQDKDGVIDEKRRSLAQANREIRDKDRELAAKENKITRISETIERNQEELLRREQEVDQLRKEIQMKKAALDEKNSEINKTQRELQAKIGQLQKTEKDRGKLAERIEEMRTASAEKIDQLKKERDDLEGSLSNASEELTGLRGELKKASTTIAMTEKEKGKLLSDLEKAKGDFQNQIEGLKSGFAKELEGEKSRLNKQLAAAKATAAEKAAAEAAYKKKADDLGRELNDKVAGLQAKIKQAEDSIEKNKKEKDDYKKYIDSLEKEKQGLASIAKESQDRERARKQIADRMRQGLAKAGVEAEVNPRTGDVTLSFGDDYFETDSAELKPSMIETLRKFIPIYANNLFEDPKIAPMVQAVEIVGFASPTYRGKYVDPQSLSEKDREAVNYNLDLSYRRAKSIFEYIFDVNRMKYSNQGRLLGLVNVSGRSYLADAVKGHTFEQGLSRETFCKKYDCRKQQKVIITFDLKDQ